MEFRCKNCGSENLEIKEKGNQTGLYCCDCGKWLKWITKEEKRVFNNKNACTPIYVPKGATNGDMIKAMFPYFQINEEWKATRHFELRTDCTEITGIATSDWWNAPYKKEVEE